MKRITDFTNSTKNLLVTDDASDYWISGETGQAVIRLSLNRFYKVSYTLYTYVYITGCQGGAVGIGLNCQSRGWQIESQLGQCGKKFSASF